MKKGRSFVFSYSIFLVFLLSNILPAQAQTSNGSDAMWKAMKELNPNFKYYIWNVYPTEVWGIGSVLKDGSRDSKGDKILLNPKFQEMPGYRFFDQNSKPSSAEFKNIIEPYINKDETPGIPDLKRHDFHDIALKFSLPSITKLLGANVDLSNKKDVTMKATFAALETRQLNKIEIIKRINSLEDKKRNNSNSLTDYEARILKLKAEKKLFIITDDVLVYGMKINVVYDKKLTNKVDVDFIGTLEKYVGEKANSSFHVTKNSDGNYTVEVKEPFIFARYGYNYENDFWK